jgi:tripartite-type tricarboxylate transporter receptor subunit TctC
MTSPSRGALLVVIVAMAVAALSFPASGQEKYPASPIRLVVGSPAGGSSTDTFARLLAEKLATPLGVNIVVDNKPGANANIAAEFVARANPNGHTLLFNTSGVVLSIALGEPLGYKLFTDLAPVALFTAVPYVIMVRPAIPANNATEFIGYLRSNPGKLTYGSAGTGNATHLGVMMFLEANKLSALHVPYKGIAPALVDLTGGRLDFAMSSVVSATPLVKGKRLRALASTGMQRSSVLPDVPTLHESGMPGFEVSGWYGVMAPAKVTPAIVGRLNNEIQKQLQDPDMLARLEQQGGQPFISTPGKYAAYLNSELERWGRLIKSAQKEGAGGVAGTSTP